MSDKDLRQIKQEIHEAIGMGKAELLVSRECEQPDIEGVRKIIKEYPIGAIYVFPNLVNGKRKNTERFYRLLDPRLQNIGRSALLREWCEETIPPIFIGDILHLKSHSGSYEGEAMACLVAPGIYSVIWTKRINGDIQVGSYALCGQSHSLEGLIQDRRSLFSIFEKVHNQ